jgi:radical SAM protein with 4Fe4S-binding SPASM domain
MYSWKQIELAITNIKRDYSLGKITIRKENKGAILFGNAHDRYRIFQLYLNPLAEFLIREICTSNLNANSAKQALIDIGQSEEYAEETLARVVALTQFEKDSSAIKYDVIDEVLSAPINLTWDITNTCNLSCNYCTNSSSPVLNDGLNIEQCLNIVDQIAELGIFNVWIGGGEPLMKTGIEKILRRLKKNNIKVTLSTNGTLLNNEKYIDLVVETCTEVNISIDGVEQAHHSSLRGPNAKIDHPVNAVKRLKTQCPHIYVTALTVIHKKNLFWVPQIIDFCYDLGCDKWTHDELYALGRGSNMSKIILSHNGYDALYEMVTKKAHEYKGRMIVEDYVRMHRLSAPGKVKPFYGCVAGNQEIAIQYDGSVYPCQKLQHDKYLCGNVKDTRLQEIWENSHVLKWLRHRNIKKTECFGCTIFSQGQCNGGCLAEKEIVFQRHDTRDPLCPENRDIYEKMLNDPSVEYKYSLVRPIPIEKNW